MLVVARARGAHRCTRYSGHPRVQKHPIRILDKAEKETRSTVIPMCKVQWSNHTEREATWEKESELRILYPYLFERYVTP